MNDATRRPAKPGQPKPPRAEALAGFTPPVAPPPAPAQPDPHPAPAAEATAPPEVPPQHQPADTANRPVMSDPASLLASKLAGSDESDTPPASENGTGGQAGLMRAMLGGAVPVDPMLDRVPLGAKTPRHYKEALRLLAFAQRRTEQSLLDEALATLIGPELLAEALTAGRGRPR
jgi:hypothetical protein